MQDYSFSSRLWRNSWRRKLRGACWISIGSQDFTSHYNDVIMSAMACQITSLAIVYSIVYSIVHSGTDRRKHQSSASLTLVRGSHQWIPRTILATRKMFPLDDVIMLNDFDVYVINGIWTLTRILFRLGEAVFEGNNTHTYIVFSLVTMSKVNYQHEFTWVTVLLITYYNSLLTFECEFFWNTQ